MKKPIKKYSLMLLLVLLMANILNAATVHILSMNDIHSAFFTREENVLRDGQKIKEPVGGAAKMSSVIMQERASFPGQVLALSAGDFTDGALYAFFNGDPEITALNKMDFDVTTIGNHEFDHEMIGFRKTLETLRFPMICSNVVFKDPWLNAQVRRMLIKTMADGTKVGIFGLLTTELATSSTICRTGEVIIEQNLEEISRNAVKQLRDAGCDIVLALTHIGFDRDKALAAKVSGINAIIGGHSHTELFEPVIVMNPDGMGVPVAQAGCYGRYMGNLVLTVENGITTNSAWRMVDLDADIPADSKVDTELQLYAAELKNKLSKPIARCNQPLDIRKSVVRCKEAPIGSFFADAFRWKSGADVAFMNGGSLRGNCVYPAGDVSYLTLNNIQPYKDYLVTLKMTGAQIVEHMEISASAMVIPDDGYLGNERTATGGFMQISGLRVTFDCAAAPSIIDNASKLIRHGSRVRNVEIQKSDGSFEAIDPAKTYTVATTDFIAGGGDKAYVMASLPNTNTYLPVLEVIAEYMRHFDGPFNLPPIGRMTFLNDPRL